ncbi:MAG: sulfatase-like hydrolase/transferase [Clostridia bacterium]|nr:sulfatase-like hydrolase/transferase [Clostridia bacterium]
MRILMIDIDTLRPDHMGCYGYGRNTTPCMDEVCREGLRFDRYYCSDAPCLPSRAALVTGMFGIHNGAVGHGGTAADRYLTGEKRDFRDVADTDNLHNLFRRAGLYTASVSTFAERHSSYWFQAGFNECINVGGCGGESGEKVLPAALDWLKRNQSRDDWFLHVHFWDPHTPYRAPKSFGEPFRDVPLDTWLNQDTLNSHARLSSPHGMNEIGMYTDQISPEIWRMPGSFTDMEGLKRLMDGYDTGIRYADHLVGQILTLLKQQGVYDDTAVIITSDHGENMGELGIYSEHGTADEPTCRIPMIVKWPGLPGGRTDAGFHYNLDLAPTMADMLGVAPSPRWDGLSWADTLTDGADTGREFLVLSQMAHVCQRSVRWKQYLYVRTYHDGFRLFDREMLFDVESDPHETKDLKHERPEVCHLCAHMLLDWFDDMMLSSPSAVDPMQTVLREGGPYHTRGWLVPYIRRLKATGRAEAALRLAEKYGIREEA